MSRELVEQLAARRRARGQSLNLLINMTPTAENTTSTATSSNNAQRPSSPPTKVKIRTEKSEISKNSY